MMAKISASANTMKTRSLFMQLKQLWDTGLMLRLTFLVTIRIMRPRRIRATFLTGALLNIIKQVMPPDVEGIFAYGQKAVERAGLPNLSRFVLKVGNRPNVRYFVE